MVVALPCPVRFCEVDFEGFVKSQEQIAEADGVVAGLLAATVLRYAHPFEPNPAISHQHRRCKIQQSQNRLAGARPLIFLGEDAKFATTGTFQCHVGTTFDTHEWIKSNRKSK